MGSPFEKPADEGRIGRLWDYVTRRDRDVDSRSKIEVAKANGALDWMNHPYFAHFMLWVEEQIDKPISLRDQTQMIGDTARCNAFKELRQHLRQLRIDAEAAVEGHDG